jgi:hypothetical protein
MATAIVSYKTKYENAKNALANLRDASRDPVARLMSAGGAVLGGGIAGVLNAKAPKIQDVPTIPVAGGLALGLSALNAKEDWSGMLANVAGGMLAVATAQQTSKWASA